MRTLNSHKYEFEYLQRTAPVMAFDKENPYVWKQQAKEKLTELLDEYKKCLLPII